MSPKPCEIPRNKALQHPFKNRNDYYLPSEYNIRALCCADHVTYLVIYSYLLTVCNSCFCAIAGDDWGVVLRGDKQDYIHATFVNVQK